MTDRRPRSCRSGSCLPRPRETVAVGIVLAEIVLADAVLVEAALAQSVQAENALAEIARLAS